ncbi:MAG: hypothetical protein IPM64_10795 [Phycisphaerales bacterium]|nr:hypothetical protein [Phycisphaerales bacterium]
MSSLISSGLWVYDAGGHPVAGLWSMFNVHGHLLLGASPGRKGVTLRPDGSAIVVTGADGVDVARIPSEP